MIPQFTTWLRAEFPAETFYMNERKSVNNVPIPDRNVLLKEGSGIERPVSHFGYQMVQCLVRDREQFKARKLSWEIFEYATSRFGQILPAVVIDGVLYPEIQTGQLSALARPQCLGEDENGRTEFVTNFQIYWRRT